MMINGLPNHVDVLASSGRRGLLISHTQSLTHAYTHFTVAASAQPHYQNQPGNEASSYPACCTKSHFVDVYSHAPLCSSSWAINLNNKIHQRTFIILFCDTQPTFHAMYKEKLLYENKHTQTTGINHDYVLMNLFYLWYKFYLQKICEKCSTKIKQ